MDLLSVLGEFVNFLGTLLPRWRLVRSTEAGVVFGRRRDRTIRGPRLIWWMPCIQDLEVVPVVRQVIYLAPQTLMTKSSETVVAGGVLVYTIKDVKRYLVENFDAEQSIGEVAGAALREAIVSRDVDEVQENSRKVVDNDLTRRAKEHLEEFGIDVERLRLTNFSRARVFNFVGVSPVQNSYQQQHQQQNEVS